MTSAKTLAMQRIAAKVLDVVFPPRCLRCYTEVSMQGALCTECWAEMQFISPPCCVRCGHPFVEMMEDAVCGQCLAEPPRYSQARAVFHYTPESRPLITRFKYGDKTYAAASFGAWMARSGKVLLEGADWLIPVPMHRLGLFLRCYNQAVLLADAVGKQCHIPVHKEVLLRTRHTKPQASLTRKQRLQNVRGAFRVNPRYTEEVKGKTIVLVDDVYTTGATIDACCRALLKKGARDVRVLTLARRIEGGDQ